MSPRDKVLAELLELAAACLVPPTAARWNDQPKADQEQRHRAIRVMVSLETVASDLRAGHPLKPASGPGSLVSLLGARLRTLQDSAAEPLPYEPYQQPAEPGDGAE